MKIIDNVVIITGQLMCGCMLSINSIIQMSLLNDIRASVTEIQLKHLPISEIEAVNRIHKHT